MSIPLSRTAVPVEWDDFRKQLEKLTETLRPTTPGGVNTLGEFINSAADNLRGTGDTARETVIKLSKAISALGDHADDIFSTVRNLQLLVSALYSSSELLASFNQNLASVTTVLTNTPNEIANALQGLDAALADVRGFVGENREALGVTFDRLSSITTALNDSRGDIKQILHIAPTVFQNFMNIYQPAQSAMTGILALNNFADIPQWICSAIESASRARLARVSKLCLEYVNPVIKNRIYNYVPIGFNPFVGPQARPSEITYSEDWLRPGYTPPENPAPSPPNSRSPASSRNPPRNPPKLYRRPRRRRRLPSRRHRLDDVQFHRSTAESDASGGPVMRRTVAAALCIACIAAVPACEWRGLNSFRLPGTAGGGPGAYTIQAQMPDVVTIQQNTRVRVNDVNVGNVTKIEVQDWHALVTMRINGDIRLPANSTAKLGQTSLLGSMHIELAPPKDEAPVGELNKRIRHPAGPRQHVSDHRANLGRGVDPAQRWRTWAATGNQPGDSQGLRRPRKRHAQSARPTRRIHRRHQQTDRRHHRRRRESQ